jgi:hypothetical protein
MLEGPGGVDQKAECGEIDAGDVAGRFFAPDFCDPLNAAASCPDGQVELQGVRSKFDCAAKTELGVALSEALAHSMVPDNWIQRLPAGGEPTGDAFDDLRDAAVVQALVLGDLPLLEAFDFDAFIDFEIAVGRRAGHACSAGQRLDRGIRRGTRVGHWKFPWPLSVVSDQ